MSTESGQTQFSPYGTYDVFVTLHDFAGNIRSYNSNGNPNDDDLCAIATPCRVENRSSTGLPDADLDGIPDDADNCPDDPNFDQTDLDLIGDACDPFPNNRDNQQAQCDADLIACLANPTFPDSDQDGEHDDTDLCPGTTTDPADDAGCSIDQFCAGFPVLDGPGRRACRKADHMNDEPHMRRRERDCTIDNNGTRTRDDDVCAPVGQ